MIKNYISQLQKDYLVQQVGRLRKKFNMGSLSGEEFTLNNLKEEYEELTDMEDLYSNEY